MSKSRIPLTKGKINSVSRKPDRQTFASSDLFHYGFASQDQKSSSKGSKEKATSLNEQNSTEKTVVKKRASKDKVLSDKTKMEKEGPVNDGEEDMTYSNVSTPAHLNLSQTQLNALSYSLSELADKISPSNNEFLDEDELAMKTKPENIGDERLTGRRNSSTDVAHIHSKTPYSRRHETKHHLSKQKSFNKKALPGESKSQSNDQESGQSGVHLDHNSIEQDDTELKAVSPIHQDSIESGYNSSWSSISWSEDWRGANKTNGDADTDVEPEELQSNETLINEDKDSSEKQIDASALQSKISDVEKRINSLIFGRRSSELETNETKIDNLGENENKLDKDSGNEDSRSTNDKSNLTTKDSFKCNKNEEQPGVDVNQNNNETPKTSTNSTTNDHDLKKSPFQVLKVRKASLDDVSLTQKPKRPGLVRRRTTLVTFRPPRKPSAFTEVDGSGVLEIDEDGFVQCLTDVRAMKTMLLKLKRELQEAEVQSPYALGRSKSVLSKSSANLANNMNNPALNDPPEEGNRRHTYDSSEMIHEKLRRIRSQSISRRKHSSCTESPLEDQSVENPGDVTSDQAPSDVTEKNTNDYEMKKMKGEFDEMKGKMKDLKQERDALFMEKEEFEHEMETKNHTIKMLQKQLEAQENNDEVTCLQRQVTTLTQQVRQQQQKILEIKYRATSPGSARKGSVKLDIKNRLRDAFARHLEESSKSHLLLSKHIEKAELTISEAQKGDTDGKHSRSSSLLTPPSFSKDDVRRHSWTSNSIDKIIKTWKDTAQSIENLASRSPKSSKKSYTLPQAAENSPTSFPGLFPGNEVENSPHLSFL